MSLYLSACGSSAVTQQNSLPGAQDLSAAAQLGGLIFVDETLSVSARQSCASCHVAQFAFASDSSVAGPDHGLPVPLGGPNMDAPGFRNTPSLMYLSFAPDFFFDAGDNPHGGFFRDGRAATLAIQAQQPFITAFEMANPNAAALLSKLKATPYFPQFVALYGEAASTDPEQALERIGEALAAFQKESSQFHPFTSRFDYWRRGQATLTDRQVRGLGFFNDPTQGNCAACHPSSSADGVTPALFTDFSYDNLGVPRNAGVPANLDQGAPYYTPVDGDDGIHTYYDLGLCGPFRAQPGTRAAGSCGQFKVPTLRNIALTAPYFHNGRFATLKDALGFYVKRDTDPVQFYPATADGEVTKFDDLPAAFGGRFVVNTHDPASSSGYLGNVNTDEIPYNRLLGELPALSETEIDDLIAFLCTLSDGFDPQNPGAQTLPAQCQ